ncbi:hypothetical protein CDL15_Pgr011663 [Punica granatum]|nr:hypothetical protein CDL15_Pgr011663 [Punica granatum]
MFYLASGYEERVEEVFQSQVTRLATWKGARVQRMRSGKEGRAAGAQGARARLCALLGAQRVL